MLLLVFSFGGNVRLAPIKPHLQTHVAILSRIVLLHSEENLTQWQEETMQGLITCITSFHFKPYFCSYILMTLF
jgi:hypothetical protein